MNKRMLIMLIICGIVLGLIFGYKAFVAHMMKEYFSMPQPPVTVSATAANFQNWQPQLVATASMNAVRGVDVTTEIAGLVQAINFTAGSTVQAGAVLAQLNADADIAQLHVYQANANIAQITYNRDKNQFKIEAVSQQTVDTDQANVQSTTAQVAQQTAIVNKKTIVAPFSGRLGIRLINLGQFLNPGDKIVSLQQLDPIYADFYVPQQSLLQLSVNQPVELTTDSFPGKTFTGTITTIEPEVETSTRNIEVEATINNPQQLLLPGMFGSISINTGNPQKYITLPQAAISYNPYGNIVFVIKQQGTDKKTGAPILIANEQFVTTGPTRGDQVAVVSGLKEGEQVVTSGQLKLRNGDRIVINNTVAPSDEAAPSVSDEGG